MAHLLSWTSTAHQSGRTAVATGLLASPCSSITASTPLRGCARYVISTPQPSRHTRSGQRCAAAGQSPNGVNGPGEEGSSWAQGGFPSYLQNQRNKRFPCEGEAVASGPADKTRWKREIQIWETVREEAQKDAAMEPLLSSFLYASILAHNSFEQSLAFVLANRLSNATMLPTQLFEIFHQVLTSDDDVRCGTLADLEAHKERDPSCNSLCHALLYFKGYHAIQSHRIAHALWQRGQTVLALALQSRMSEVFAVDIHPAARIGKGILLDHGTGVVIGETAVIEDNCSLLQNVTLGGTGKDMGDRHPKVAANVLIGASATILGNIEIGEGAQIAAGSLVLKPVPPHTMVAGSPAKVVGKVMDNPAETMLHWRDKNQVVMTASLEELEERTKGRSVPGRNDADEYMPPNADVGASGTSGYAAGAGAVPGGGVSGHNGAGLRGFAGLSPVAVAAAATAAAAAAERSLKAATAGTSGSDGQHKAAQGQAQAAAPAKGADGKKAAKGSSAAPSSSSAAAGAAAPAAKRPAAGAKPPGGRPSTAAPPRTVPSAPREQPVPLSSDDYFI